MSTDQYDVPEDYQPPRETPQLYGPGGNSPATERVLPERPDPGLDRALTDAYRSARRTLSASCGVALAWATAQFDVTDLKLEGAVTIELSAVSIPLLLGAALVYLINRNVRACMPFRLFARLARYVCHPSE